eukprot:3652521-Rhodomonas_salina.1
MCFFGAQGLFEASRRARHACKAPPRPHLFLDSNGSPFLSSSLPSSFLPLSAIAFTVEFGMSGD